MHIQNAVEKKKLSTKNTAPGKDTLQKQRRDKAFFRQNKTKQTLGKLITTRPEM